MIICESTPTDQRHLSNSIHKTRIAFKKTWKTLQYFWFIYLSLSTSPEKITFVSFSLIDLTLLVKPYFTRRDKAIYLTNIGSDNYWLIFKNNSQYLILHRHDWTTLGNWIIDILLTTCPKTANINKLPIIIIIIIIIMIIIIIIINLHHFG